MTTFASLLENPKSIAPGILQRKAEEKFGLEIAQSGFHRRDPAEPIPRGLYVVIGIATYSQNELAMLDEIASRSSTWSEWLRVDVFSVLECKMMRDFHDFFPGIRRRVLQTPVLGVWREQQLTDFVTGLKECRDVFMGLLSSHRQRSRG